MGAILRLSRRPQHIGGVLLRSETGGPLSGRPSHDQGAGVHSVKGGSSPSPRLHKDLAGPIRSMELEKRTCDPAGDGAATVLVPDEPLRLLQLGQGYYAAPEYRDDSSSVMPYPGQRVHPRTLSERADEIPETQTHAGSGQYIPHRGPGVPVVQPSALAPDAADCHSQSRQMDSGAPGRGRLMGWDTAALGVLAHRAESPGI